MVELDVLDPLDTLGVFPKIRYETSEFGRSEVKVLGRQSRSYLYSGCKRYTRHPRIMHQDGHTRSGCLG